ncbi:hypothetical protein [Burkholderia stagnalis]|uniref:hypothetical protein n=1 Tax=Burkholderia stagnalis TaxID=1503054 RepID=UPI0012D8BB8C|nr:hypothetical protein [Burkholderia stagnalis]
MRRDKWASSDGRRYGAYWARTGIHHIANRCVWHADILAANRFRMPEVLTYSPRLVRKSRNSEYSHIGDCGRHLEQAEETAVCLELVNDESGQQQIRDLDDRRGQPYRHGCGDAAWASLQRL